MKLKKLAAAVLSLSLCLTSLSAFASSSDTTDSNFYDLIYKEDFQSKTDAVTSFPTSGALVTGNFQEEDGNKCQYTYRVSGSSWSNAQFVLPSDKKNWSATTEGEWVLESKAKFIRNNTNNICSFIMQVQTGNNQITTEISSVDANGTTDNAVKFEGAQIGTVKITSGVWYTFRNTYNFDTAKALVEIYSPDQKVFSAEVDMTGIFNTADALMGSWDGVVIYASTTTVPGNAVLIDDVIAAKSTKKPVTVTYDDTMGSVKYAGSVVTSGAETAVNYNEDAVFTVAPAEGYKVDTVTVGGSPVAVSGDNTFTLTGVKSAQAVVVTFAEDTDAPVKYYDTVYLEDFESKTGAATSFPTSGELVTGNFQEEDGNRCTYAYRVSGSNWNKLQFKLPSDKNSLSSTTEGEWVLESKAKFIRNNTNKVCDFTMQVQTGNNQIATQMNSVDANGTTDNAVTFEGTQIGTVKITSGVWYTFRNTYNFDTAKALVEIYSPAKKVFSAEVDMTGMFNTADALKGSWDNIIMYSSVTTIAGNAVMYDDIKVERAIRKPVTVTYDDTKGSVTYAGSAVTSGDETAVVYGADAVFTIAPAEGYEVESVTVGGAPVVLPADNTLTLSGIKSAQSVVVTFKEIFVIPTVASSSIITSNDYNGNESAVIYAKVTGNANEIGIRLKNKDGNELKLPAMIDADNKLTTGDFAIRVFGAAMISGDTYKYIPYIEYDGGNAEGTETPFVFGAN